MATNSLIWIISLSTIVIGQTLLPEDNLQPKTVCAEENLGASCNSGQEIIVQDVQYGTKLSQTCGPSDKPTGCCDYADTDCFLPYDGGIVEATCSGRDVCNNVNIAQTDKSNCNASYPVLNHYLTMTFSCVPNARIGHPSSSVSITETGKLLYVQNTDYPATIRSTETSSTCSVETRSCSLTLNVYFVHFELADGGGLCNDTQHVFIEDRDINRTYTCSNNTDYAINRAFTSSSNYLKIEFKNLAGVNDGYFWIAFEEMNTTALLSLDCPIVPQTMCMDCPPLSNINNGRVSTDGGLSTGQNATYSCNNGYHLTGDSVRTCQENGTWDNEEPTCQIIECPVLNSPANGNVTSAGGRTYGQTATYFCQYGYRLVGSSDRVCQEDGNWSGSDPTCTLIECPVLRSPANGNVTTAEGRTYGQTATYSCQYGYRLDGNSSRVCGAGDNWSDSEPSCVQIVCPELSNPPNGSVTVGVNSTVDTTAIYTCNETFRIEGDAARVCLNNGTWSSNEPECTLIDCPNLTAPLNGTVKVTGRTLGETASYSCNHGYALSDDALRTCANDGTWTGRDPVCRLRTCDPLPNPMNGNVSTEGLAIGQSATYSCYVEYILTGDQTRTCQTNYTWSGAEPVCNRRELGGICTTESDCSAAISGSTCNNSVCVCGEGLIKQSGGCVTVEIETKEKPDDGLSEPVIIIIAVAAAVVLIVIITTVVLVCRRQKKANHLIDDKPNNVQAFNNNAYNDVVPISGETWVITDFAQSRRPDVQSTDASSVRREEHSVENETVAPTQTENILNELMESNQVVPKNQPIQQSDVDQSDQLHCEDSYTNTNTDIARNDNQTSDNSNESQQRPCSSHGVAEHDELESKSKTKDNFSREEHQEKEAEDTIADRRMADDLQTSELEAIEQQIKEADLNLNLDRESSQVSHSIKDLAAALFRSASLAKRNLIARGKAGDYHFEFETSEDSDWSNGLLTAAKQVLAAIYHLCNIANDLAEGKTSDEMLEAAAQEIRRATNALIVAYRLEGDLESSALKDLKDACIAVSGFADSLVETTIKHSDNQSTKRKNMTLEGGEVQKSKQLIEASASVIQKEKELQKARENKALLNQELNKFDKDDNKKLSTEL